MELKQMSELVHALVKAEARASTIETQLKVANKKAQYLREESIPTAMQELGLTRLDLEDGQIITIKQTVYARIPVDNKLEAFSWLEDHELGGAIKSTIKLEFGKGELEKADDLMHDLESEGYSPTFDRNVHGSTLKAVLKEEIAKGTVVPLDLFEARAVFVANVKESK